MKLGLVSAILPDYCFEEVVDFAALVGYKSLEIMCWPIEKAARRYAGVTHIDIAKIDNKKIEYIKDYIVSKNIDIAALGYYPNPLDPDLQKRNYYINHIKDLIVAAKKLGVNIVSTFIGKDKSKTEEENFQIFKQVWKPIIEFAEQSQVTVVIENCPMYFTADEWPGGCNLASNPHIWRKMFKEIPSKYFGINYDPSHMVLQGMDYIKPIYEFKERIKYVHIKDLTVYQEKIDEYGRFTYPLNYCAPKIPGLGQVGWGRFLSALRDIEYRGFACVEIEDRAFEDSIDSVKQAIRISYNYISRYFV